MRVVRTVGLLAVGFVAAFAAAAALARRALPSRGDAESDEIALVAIFDGVALRSRASAFRGGSVLAWFGGVALDLRDATPVAEMRITARSFAGGVAVRVPEGWRVESSARALAGAVAVNVPAPEAPDAPTLVLDGLAAFGGIAVGTRVADGAFDE